MEVINSESIKALLDQSDAAVIRGMRAIHARQTADEQAGHMTRHTNGVGWSKFDAPWMTDMIAKVQRWGGLTPKQMAVTRNKLKRYHRQLVEIALENRAAEAVPATLPVASHEPERQVREAAGSYGRLASYCRCEDYDGERLCDFCQDIRDKNEFARLEALAEINGFASDPDYGSL